MKTYFMGYVDLKGNKHMMLQEVDKVIPYEKAKKFLDEINIEGSYLKGNVKRAFIIEAEFGYTEFGPQTEIESVEF